MLSEIGFDEMIKMFKFRYGISNIYIQNYNKLMPINANSIYVKYTAKSTMYNILETDALYLFCSELSNDLTENHILPTTKSIDTYISCFYQGNNNDKHLPCNDVYSQWMSYCQEGGASFEFYFGQDLIALKPEMADDKKYYDRINHIGKLPELFEYSVLCNNLEDKSKFIKYYSFPFQVQYYDGNVLVDGSKSDGIMNDNTYMLQVKRILDKNDMESETVSAYFKHSGFVQESEARLAFLNENNRLEKCIHFMNKQDGTKLPYIIVKFGDNDENNRPCAFVDCNAGETLADAVARKIDELPRLKLNQRFPIIIPQGYNQETVYNLVEAAVKKRMGEDFVPKIICKGHLPITKITLAPTADRKMQRKQMEIYCKNKYWLRNVEICESKIPYNTQNSNHV